MRARIKVGENVHATEIEVNGRRIEGGVRSFYLSQQAGHAARIRLDLAVTEETPEQLGDRVLADVEGDVTVMMTTAAHDALIALGWTPPAQG